jgi:hypothetical protein|nr:restriction endonuclease [uncultured bacterium]
MKNTGRDYESLVESVFTQLLEQDSVKNITIEKNKILQGKTTTHEIDVYWEFIAGGIKYSTIIQAKDWNQKVPQGEILKLKAIIEDLPGQPRGVFITRTGYQQGALDVAKANGIITYELREPTEEDWKGRIKTVVLSIKAYIPNTKVEVIADNEWLQEELKRLNLKELKLVISGQENEILIKNEDGSLWKSLYDIKKEESEKIGMHEVYGKEILIPMEVARYIQTGNKAFPKMKIKAVKAIVSNGLIEDVMEIDGSKMVGYILKNIFDNSEIVFDKHGVIRKNV